jgi:hypothetical protein
MRVACAAAEAIDLVGPLGTRTERPRRRAAEKRDERATAHVEHGALPSSRVRWVSLAGGCQPRAAVTLRWDYTHRSMTRRIRIELGDHGSENVIGI